MVYKVIRRLFTYLGAVFLMSYIIFANNVHAARSVFDLSNYEVVHSAYNPSMICRVNGVDMTGSNLCSYYQDTTGVISGTNLMTRIYTSDLNWSFKKGDIVEFDVIVFSATNFYNYGSYLYVGSGITYPNFLIIEVTQTVSNQFYHVSWLDVNTGAYQNGTYFSYVYHVVGQILNDYTGDVGLYGNNNFPLFTFSLQSAADNVNAKISNLATWRYVGSEDNKEVADATQDAADDSQDAGDDSTSDAEQSTSSLLSAIGSAVSAISSASPTNCKINGNMGHLNMGQIDLCANPVPAYVSTIGSLILILMVVPLCISLFNRFIGLFRSFQG